MWNREQRPTFERRERKREAWPRSRERVLDGIGGKESKISRPFWVGIPKEKGWALRPPTHAFMRWTQKLGARENNVLSHTKKRYSGRTVRTYCKEKEVTVGG